MRHLSALRVILLVLCLATFGSTAQAQLSFTFTLTPDAATIAPGDQIALLASVTNTSGEDILLTAAAINSLLSVDDAAFLTLFANPIASGATLSENIFVQSLVSTPEGQYPVQYSVEFTGQTSNNIGTLSPTANITVGAAVAPEPGFALLVGVLAVGMVLRRRRRA